MATAFPLLAHSISAATSPLGATNRRRLTTLPLSILSSLSGDQWPRVGRRVCRYPLAHYRRRWQLISETVSSRVRCAAIDSYVAVAYARTTSPLRLQADDRQEPRLAADYEFARTAMQRLTSM
jgi:hypothetical protein